MALSTRLTLAVVQDFRHVFGYEPFFQILDPQHVAIAHHEIDVVERNALGIQTIIDDILKKAGVVLRRVIRSLLIA